MDGSSADEKLVRQRIASNIAMYRKLCGLTQSELAEKLCYSDKSVSKWERGSGVPDIYVLVMMAELFGVTVNELVTENENALPPPTVSVRRQRILIFLLAIGLVWLAATVVYTLLNFIQPGLRFSQYIFIGAIPGSCVVAVVFTSLWWGIAWRAVAVTALVWTVAACVYIMMPLSNSALIFAVGGVMQVLVFLWFLMKSPFMKGRRDKKRAPEGN